MAAEIKYEDLQKEYNYFINPMAVVVVNDNELKPAKTGLSVGNIEIESSSGFEAGIATFHIYGCYNKIKSCFERFVVCNRII